MTQYYKAVRPLTDEEYNSLRQDIEKRGIVSPVIVDGEGNIIDGFHRSRIAQELGIDYPTKTVEGTPAELQAMAIALNVARRQLTREETRGLIATLLKADPTQSNRMIAEVAGKDDKTVASIRKGLEATAEIPQSNTRTSRDGRSRPAQRTGRPQKPAKPPIPLAGIRKAFEALTPEQQKAFLAETRGPDRKERVRTDFWNMEPEQQAEFIGEVRKHRPELLPGTVTTKPTTDQLMTAWRSLKTGQFNVIEFVERSGLDTEFVKQAKVVWVEEGFAARAMKQTAAE